MTKHQALVWRHVRESEGGLTPTQAGRVIHASTGAHPEDVTCPFCASAGKSVLENLKHRGLVSKRRSGIYQAVRKRRDTGHIPF